MTQWNPQKRTPASYTKIRKKRLPWIIGLIALGLFASGLALILRVF